METSARIGLWFGLGVPLLFVEFLFQTVTLSGGRYAGVLTTALILTIIADVCFVQAFKRGGMAARCFSVLLVLPTLFVVADPIRRGPHLFR